MRAALGLTLLVAGCAASAPPVEAPRAEARTKPAAPPTESWRGRAPDGDCQAGLGALVAGKLDAFRGIGRCGRVDAEAAIGSSGDAPSRFEQLGEYREYPRDGGSVLAWFTGGDLRVVELLFPKLPRTIVDLVGAPEAKADSKLSAEWEQWIWASRGLTAHVRRSNGEVVALFAYRPTTVAAFLQTDIARAAKTESPVEELK